MGAQGAGKFVPFKYGNMDQWVTRSIKESGIIGGFDKTIENWRVVAGFRNTMRNPLFTSLGRLTGAGNGLVIGLGPNESDGVIKLEGQGAGAKPTVNTMLDDYLKIREFEQ